MKGKKLNEESIAEVKRLYIEESMSIREVAARLGTSASPVKNSLQHLGLIRTPAEARQLACEKGKHPVSLSGSGSIAWKSGKTHHASGYILVMQKGHHRATKNGYVYEQIAVWEQVHNKPVPEGWVVHHLNGIKSDNRPANLVAMPKAKHSRVESCEPYKQRIRVLEAEVKLLEKALDNSQMIFRIEEN